MRIGIFTDIYLPTINGVVTVIRPMEQEIEGYGITSLIYPLPFGVDEEEAEAGRGRPEMGLLLERSSVHTEVARDLRTGEVMSEQKDCGIAYGNLILLDYLC